ncbi:hypothetical protein Hanom_Chr14g01291881 [Helianthus anomalus]
MAIKMKPQGPRFKKFEIWTKMTKVPKPQGPKWQFTHFFISVCFYIYQLRIFLVIKYPYMLCFSYGFV